MTTRFPSVSARNLQGFDVDLPGAFVGVRNIVMLAFDRNHQVLVDSWVPWIETQAAEDPGLRFFEVPAINRKWAPFRRLIDGGMASAIKVPEILQRTLTYYGDLNRLTTPLGIVDRSTIAVLLVDQQGDVLWLGSGAFVETSAAKLEAALNSAAER